MFKSWLVAHENWISVGSFLVPGNCENAGFCTIYPRDLSILHFGVATPLFADWHRSIKKVVLSHEWLFVSKFEIDEVSSLYRYIRKAWSCVPNQIIYTGIKKINHRLIQCTWPFPYCPCYQHETLISDPRDDFSRGLITWAIWKRPCINLFITYFARADNMLLPVTRGHILCYCPRKMLLPRGQITRRKLCFYYTCKFGVISIKYVIIYEYLSCL